MRKKIELPYYDRGVLDAIERHSRVYNEYRVWLFKKGVDFHHKHIVEFLHDIGFYTEIIKMHDNKYRWTVNGITYANYSYKVELNCNYSCILKCLDMREKELES